MSCTARRSLGVLLTLVAAAASSGGDWPQWGGSDARNMVSPEQGLPASFEPGKKSGGSIALATTRNVLWAARLGCYAYGNPTVADGRLFVGTDDDTLRGDKRLKRTRAGLVQCFDAATGKLLWRLPVPKRTRLPKGAHFGHQHLGVCSSPAVEGDRLYLLTSACEVVCLDVQGQADGNDGPFRDEAQYIAGDGQPVELAPSDGDILWRFDLIDELGVVPHDAASCSPLVHRGMVYTSTSNGVDKPHKKMVNPDAPSLVVLDARTGRLAATDGQGIGHRMYHCQWSSPSAGSVGGRDLVFLGGGDGVCYAFQALARMPDQPVHLHKVWAYDCNPRHYKYRDGKLIPYYDGDKRKKRGNKNDGKYVGPSQIIATPVFHQGRVYVAIGQDPAHGRGKGLLHCIDAATGRQVWSYDGLDRSISTVAVADGLVYAPDIAGRLHCLDAHSGSREWVHETKAESWGSPLVADGKVFLGTKRELVVLRAGREKKVLAEIRLGTPLYGTPVAADGVLYVPSNRFLWAVAAGTEKGE
ncbi:MAG: PQQ-binding-like beta-propeller repeat protein [Candidatus Brocadiia bacterium]